MIPNVDLVARLAILVALLAGVALIVLAVDLRRRWMLRQICLAPKGTPTLLYFSSESCVQCHTQQWPAIQRALAACGGVVSLQKVDALAQPNLASQWGVLTVPTTVVLDRSGRPTAINYGVAETRKLLDQLAQAGVTLARPSMGLPSVETRQPRL